MPECPERAACPVCGAPPERPERACNHVVAWTDGSTLVSPLDGLDLPWLSGDAARRRWPDEYVAEAFGELAPLIDEYGALADWRPGLSARVLWSLLAEFLTSPVAPVTAATTGTASPGDRPTTFWCATDPDAARTEARVLVALLNQGYVYLESLASQPAPSAHPSTRSTTDRRVA
jgi:hypothetical protein